MKGTIGVNLKIVTINVPTNFLKAIEKLVGNDGLYPSRSELIRVAVREFLIDELKKAENSCMFKQEEEIKEFDPKKFVSVPTQDFNENNEEVRTFKTYKILRRLEN